jgi:hypothetical protein
LNGEGKGSYDKFRYENAHCGHNCRIRFSGGDNSISAETRNNMDIVRNNVEYLSRSVFHGHCSRNACGDR